MIIKPISRVRGARAIPARLLDEQARSQLLARIDALLTEKLVKTLSIADIALPEHRCCSADILYPLQGDQAAITQVVEYHDIVSGLNQRDTGVAADIASTTRHQYSTGHMLFPCNTRPKQRRV